ncbi:phosphoribosylaminoimidazolesuccinocarboxamide synthase [Alkalispirochaeta sphaeroplastigenens]|uniref:Phosphoribosylaminoimidazole-succinocarboxamide synthase n=1 Tax=Alkalispirochaeta sphaeroplastigenens TaxID=1187066 RepID=A0A2S4JR94_9SPIO|nr:phosphoribosylaminoimidazolesuccinocarboxamide synthase [Alkalispirochaeta sphaeroplastigenens]POR02003.1 phosphoribosylaminoimidazolesuccinocarboxamide synthase [Alkalispirochaeta sphaeroplastigenens]
MIRDSLGHLPGVQREEEYRQRIAGALGRCLTETDLPLPEKQRGKVRDRYRAGDSLILVSTDRQSAFDRLLASVPFKGQVLNQTSAWWFAETRQILENHLEAVPHPNVSVVRPCTPFPIEFVVRGYITGTTETSLWTRYKAGERRYCGTEFPEGLEKDQELPRLVVTPTTKGDRDRPVSPEEILREGLMSRRDWERCRDYALDLFAFGQQKARENGLILVDTKYEMGRDGEGEILLIDEIHTPDSSRYWIAGTYGQRREAGESPDHIDKEFLRAWFADRCDPYGDPVLPEAPRELIEELSYRYILLFEAITGGAFAFPELSGGGRSLAGELRAGGYSFPEQGALSEQETPPGHGEIR